MMFQLLLRPLRLAPFIIAFCVVGNAPAAVNDILPGDFYPLPPGTSSLALYAYEREQEGPYLQGHKAINGQIDSSVVALRGAHTFAHDGRRYSIVAVLPWADARVSPAPLTLALGERGRGYGDLRFGLTGWLVDDKERARYLALSGMLIAPSGDYDRLQVVNPGENRWKFVLFGGWQQDITPRFLVELAPEIAWYGDNAAYLGKRRLEQKASFALTGYLRWRVTPAWHLHLGGQINRGGATRVDGVDQNNPSNNDRLMAGATWFMPDHRQALLRFVQDQNGDNGFRSRREIVLRLQQNF